MGSVKTRLLIVADEARVRRKLEIIFTILGYAVRASPDRSCAFNAIRDDMPDIILSDLDMPGMSGSEFLLVVRRRFPCIRVIAMSKVLAGTAVPPGVAADAFYERGRHLRSLLGIVEAMARPGRPREIRFPRIPLRPSALTRTGTSPRRIVRNDVVPRRSA